MIKQLEISNIKIFSTTDYFDQLYSITPEIREKLTEMNIKVQKKKNSAIKELNDLIKKYPGIPAFRNYLSSLYNMQGNQFMSNEVNRKIRELFPDYVQGYLNEINIALQKKELERASEILAQKTDIKSLFPKRESFHFSEVVGFYHTFFNYNIETKNCEQAQICIDIIKEVTKQFEVSYDISTMESRLSFLNIELSLKRLELERTIRRTPEVIAKSTVEPTTKAPVFTHPIISQLYCNSIEIDQQIISEILALPPQTLLDDLHKVVYDSMARFETFADMDWDIQTHEFVMHALLLLTELNDESSVEVFLDVLRQDSEYFETWFGDFLTDGFWELLYVIANDKLELLYNYVIEPNGYTYSKSCVSQMTEQVVLHQPERRLEVVDWYKRVFEYWIANEVNDDIIDTELIAFFISDVVNIQLTELMPEITILFNLDLVAQGISGSLEHCLKDMNELCTIDYKNKIFSSITERYNNYLSTWLNYGKEDEDEEDDDDEDEDDENRKEIYEQVKNIIPLPGEKPKVGRNEPCPCGSGKKFKKCCL
ncbi:MAG: DUF1186 domain-containing protein [Paludibacter sp.]